MSFSYKHCDKIYLYFLNFYEHLFYKTVCKSKSFLGRKYLKYFKNILVIIFFFKIYKYKKLKDLVAC